ncbi:hypothetical protein V5799_016629, partial [Amblyomma americanum]
MLSSILPRMPKEESLIPGWFDSVEMLFHSFSVPESVPSITLIPYLTERMRSMAMQNGTEELIEYKKLKEVILRELRLSPAEYKRMFDTAKKGPQESWRQFGYRLRSYCSYYISSRKVTEMEELMELVVVDKLKEVLPNDALRQIALQENKSWLKLDGLTEIVEAVESSWVEPSGANIPRVGMISGE